MQPPIQIDELRLIGYRAFENARLEIEPLTVLVGRNGAGKSTLIDALEFVGDALSDSLENALERRGWLRALQHRGSQSKPSLTVAINLRMSSQHVREVSERTGLALEEGAPPSDVGAMYGFRLAPVRGGAGFLVEDEVAICGKQGFVVGKQLKKGALIREKGALIRDALSLPIRARQDLLLRSLLEALKTGIRTYNLSPAALRAEPPIGRASLLRRDGANAGDVLRYIEANEQEHQWVVRHLAAITPGIVDVRSGTAAGRRLIRFIQRSDTRARVRFEVGDMSDGTLRCLGILLALRQRPVPAIVCIDGIEESVHPAALGVLLDAAAASTERCQVLLTTHSPEALSHPSITARQIRVIEWSHGRSQVFCLGPEAEAMSRPPRSVGTLLRTNALFTAERPKLVKGDALYFR
jgi:predicted ATPase